jgi:hypothetical protein
MRSGRELMLVGTADFICVAKDHPTTEEAGGVLSVTIIGVYIFLLYVLVHAVFR